MLALGLGYGSASYAQNPYTNGANINPYSGFFSVNEAATLEVGYGNNDFVPIPAGAQAQWYFTVPPSAEVLQTPYVFDNGSAASFVDVVIAPYNSVTGQLVTITQKPGVVFPTTLTPGGDNTLTFSLVGRVNATSQRISIQPRYLNPLFSDNFNGDDTSVTFYNIVGILAQKLGDFTAKEAACGIVDLKWNTFSEHNMAQYNVEYSQDGRDFSLIKTVTAKNAAQGASYATTVNQQDNTGYYRLKMVNADRTFEYSPVKRVGMDCVHSPISVYPNPASEIVNITDLNGTETISFVSVDGKVVLQQKAEKGTNTINIVRLAAGSYTILIRNGDATSNFKIVKK